jgi:hypothetical protein
MHYQIIYLRSAIQPKINHFSFTVDYENFQDGFYYEIFQQRKKTIIFNSNLI